MFALCGFPPAGEGLPQPLSPPSLQPAKLEELWRKSFIHVIMKRIQGHCWLLRTIKN